MVVTLAKWENNFAPALSIEPTYQQTLVAFWGAFIPAIPDLISQEQFRTEMNYETALNKLLQEQQQWIRQLHGAENFTLSLRCITQGDPEQDLFLGIVGKTEGVNEVEITLAARNFYNKIRDTLPNGYSLKPCNTVEELALLRMPFLPEENGEVGEFRRSVTHLQTISSPNFPDAKGTQINPWTPQESNFQELLRSLINNPAPAAIAINLHPTRLTPEESQEIGAIADAYARAASTSRTESFQIQAFNTGDQYQQKLLEAEQAAQAWTRLQQSWRNCFEMTISILAQTPIPQSILAALQSAINGKQRQERQELIQASGTGFLVTAQTAAQRMAAYQNWADVTLHQWANSEELGLRLRRIPWLFSPEEVHTLFRLPIADRNRTWGLPSAPGATDARRPQSLCSTPSEIRIGNLELTKKQLTQHLLISGVPGSGKTNTSLYLLETLWREHRIPWMVLEPAKTEYRGLKTVDSLKDDLLVFSLGDERVAPFRFNPFDIPPTINLDSHLGALVDLFSVSMSMWGPLPNVVEQLIMEAYRRKGFTSLGNNSKLRPPCFSDLAILIPEIVPKLGYSQESTDEILAAISVRINKLRRGLLGKMLDTTDSVPFDQLMQRPVILEMSQITNTYDRAFVMGLILNRCYQYWIVRRHQATGELKHLLLIEEAHNLLGNVPESTNREQANPKGKAVKNFANMLAEVRGFGQGIAIAEQNPDGLVPDVMVNTNIKLAHRVVEAKNREALSRSMLLTPQQEKGLASLKAGEILYYIGGNPEPNLTSVPNFKDNPANRFNPHLTDDEICADFQSFLLKNHYIYAPPTGCSIDSRFTFCIELGTDLVQSLLENTRYKGFKNSLILELLTVPFGGNIKSTKQVIGSILVERGANHLSFEEIQETLNSAISLLTLEAVKEKGSIHGWLGHQVEKAHQILIQAIFNPSSYMLDNWIEICRIPEPLLQLGLPHPEYANWSAPGVFRYENKIFLEGDRTAFEADIDADVEPSLALQNWAEIAPIYGFLDNNYKQSLLGCLAVQLTRENPTDLDYFLPR